MGGIYSFSDNASMQMSLQITKYHGDHGLQATCELEAINLQTGKLKGWLDIEVPNHISKPISYEIIECRDIMVKPFEFKINSIKKSNELFLRVTGDKPKFVLEPTIDAQVDIPEYSLALPPLDVLPFYERVFEEGLCDSLVTELIDIYGNKERVTLHQFRDDSKKILAYKRFLKLQKLIAEYNDSIREELSETRHRRFKNMPLGHNAGGQFSATSIDEFEQRIAQYEQEGLDTVLGEINGATAVEMIIDNASNRNAYLDNVCNELNIVASYAKEIGLGHFVNILSQTLLGHAPTSGDDITVDTIDWQDSIQLNPQELVKRRFGDNYMEKNHIELKNKAYESKNLDLFKKSLAAAITDDSESFYHAAADLLYWYTEITSAIPLAIQPRIYAVAEGLYRSVENSHMADSAYFRKSKTEGQYQSYQEDYRAAGMAFFQAYNISTQKDVPIEPFDKIGSFMKIAETNIRKHRNKGDFLEGFEEAEDGLDELRNGSLENTETTDEEILLQAWKDDLLAQHQQQEGRFKEAIETTGNAIGEFKQVGAETEAETAQTRRLQLEAITAQLDLNFKTASDIHEKAAEEIGETNRDTGYFHECQATICEAKHSLLNKKFQDAIDILEKVAYSSAPPSNLLVLTETFQRYNKEEKIDTEALIERLDTQEYSDSTIGRHISYDGDYTSVAILLSTVQKFQETDISTELLDQIVRAALKDAISGGTTKEWQEISELSQINTDDIWRRLLPSAFTEVLEDIDQRYHQPSPNYAAPAMELLAALEGYLRVMAEYYARLKYDDWRSALETNNKNINLADIEMFFNSDPAADAINSIDFINKKLSAEDYSNGQDTLRDVRNDLGHNNRTIVIEKETFEKLRDDVHDIMRTTSKDMPVVAEVIDVRERTGVHSASLDWSRLPRRIDFQTKDYLEQGSTVYLPPEMEIESGFADVDDNKIVPCTSTPDNLRNQIS